MRIIKYAGLCLLIAILLSGCGSKNASTSDTGSIDTAVGNSDGSAGPRASFDPNRMQMMLTFASLLRMDQTDGLAITKDEAAKMIPIVQASMDNNTLTDDQKTELESGLTAEQQKFLADSANAAGNFRQGFRGGRGNLSSPGPNDSPRPSFSPRPRPSGGFGVNAAGNGSPRPRPSGGFGGGRFANGGGFANIAQQLLDLLNSK